MESVLGRESSWYRLDNAAKMYPAILNPKESCVFRVSVNLTSDVDQEILQQAVLDCKPRFPSFYVKLRSGFFWNYYEYNEKPPIVKPESPYINQHIDSHANNGYHFTVFYYKNRISLEIFHGLCDGGAAMEFLKALVYHYFWLLGYAFDSEGIVLKIDEPPRSIEVEDSFLDHYQPSQKERAKVKHAYRLKGERFPEGIGVINGKLQADQMYRLAEKNRCTFTQYLAALLTYCIWQADDKAKRSAKPINVCVPVNMRRFFDSRTLRNFSLYLYTSTECNNRELSFDLILAQVKKDFESGLKKERLQQILNANVAAEKNLALRLCPLVLKNAAIRIACIFLGEKRNTCAVSNLGNVKMPDPMSAHIRDFDFNSGVGYDTNRGLSAVTYNGRMTISFSRSIYDTKIERLFFTYLANQGIEIEIQSNLWENFA